MAAVAIDGAIMVSFLLSDGWLERRMGVLEGAVARVEVAPAPELIGPTSVCVYSNPSIMVLLSPPATGLRPPQSVHAEIGERDDRDRSGRARVRISGPDRLLERPGGEA